MKALTTIALALLVAGCGSIIHTRDIIKDGELVGREREVARGFLMKAALENLSVSTRESTNGYSHNFNAKGVQMSGDSEMAKTLIESTGTAVGNGIGAAAKAAK